ncbi:UDP-glycosyltransferase [Quillaja saponaria]|uniref:UDP-glycosyltransferase n=1 Tax=Quillaja saponaria TaxID=32244 RepID=A0AAD7L8D1_QUISA|nr:UDP-glycosyltransferase [Quillaja saponaria]
MENDKKLHIAMFPWLAFGHIIPYLELAKLIAQKGHFISFISTPNNIDRLPKLPSNIAPLIKFVKLTLPNNYQDKLPPNAEATSDVPKDIVPYLKHSYDGLQKQLSEFLEDSNPDWIIYDFTPYWLPPITAKLSISTAFFCILFTSILCILGPSATAMITGDDPRNKPEDFTVPPKWVPFPTNQAYRLYQAKHIFNDHFGVNPSGVSDMFRAGSIISGCDLIVLRTCLELQMESKWVELTGKLHQKPVVPIGLLPPSLSISEHDDDNHMDKGDDTWLNIRNWLDKQKNGSIVYVAFGSEVTLGHEDLTELALGLEESGLPFFWALKKPKLVESLELPIGFEKRTKDRGLVWTGWVPQYKILGHKSVGVFLTHCGWGSTIEALHFGHALVMLPFLIDQGLVARYLEEIKVGIEIPRNEEDGRFTRNEVSESLRLVLLTEEGKTYKDNANEISKIFGDKELHQRYIDDFVEHLQNHKRAK